MKKLLLTFSLLSFFTLQALEYDPIQKAIINRNVDELAQLLKTKKLTVNEKIKYLDLAHQVVLGFFLRPEKPIETWDKIKITAGLTAPWIISFGLMAYFISVDLNDKYLVQKHLATIAGITASKCFFLAYLFHLISESIKEAQLQNSNAIQIKQLLFDI